jgi:hypothetical protein
MLTNFHRIKKKLLKSHMICEFIYNFLNQFYLLYYFFTHFENYCLYKIYKNFLSFFFHHYYFRKFSLFFFMKLFSLYITQNLDANSQQVNLF